MLSSTKDFSLSSVHALYKSCSQISLTLYPNACNLVHCTASLYVLSPSVCQYEPITRHTVIPVPNQILKSTTEPPRYKRPPPSPDCDSKCQPSHTSARATIASGSVKVGANFARSSLDRFAIAPQTCSLILA